MVQLIKRSSDIRISELNLSQIIIGSSGTVAVLPVVSAQGRTSPTLFTNSGDWTAEYGNPNPSISQTIQAGLDYFLHGTQLWGVRVTMPDATYAGLLLIVHAGATTLVPVTFTTPVGLDINTLNPYYSSSSPSSSTTIALFYGLQGPGSWVNSTSVSITTKLVSAPTVTATPAITGGTLATGTTYQYKVSALSTTGESLGSTLATATVASGSVGSVTLAWGAVPGAVGYRIYGNNLGAVTGLLTTVGGATLTWTDTGVLSPDTTQQPITVSANADSSAVFTVNVYNNAIPNAGPIESWDCTLLSSVNSQGIQTELANRINPFSGMIQAVNNTAALASVPVVPAIAKIAFTGGSSGSAVTSSAVVSALQVFKNSQLYKTNVYINGGIADPVTQLGMDTLVQGRGDSVALLDVPSISQQFQAAIDYRNLTLNLNSSYSSLFNPDLMISDLVNGQRLYVPPSGHVAALCALTDQIANPATSIAGLNRGIVNVLRQRYTYDDGQATAMFNAQVNYFRTFVGQGIALWEQQTLAAEFSALSWLSVRRIINVLKVALYQFLLYSLEEMNSDAVRRAVVNGGSSYLDTLVNAGAISSYAFVCDATNNPPAAANAGILVVTVIIVPSIPIHEIQLQVGISKSGVSFSETLAAINGS